MPLYLSCESILILINKKKIIEKNLKSESKKSILGLDDQGHTCILKINRHVLFNFLGSLDSQEKPDIEEQSIKSESINSESIRSIPPELPPKDYFEEIV